MPPKYIPKPQELVLSFLQDKDNIKDLLFVESMDSFYWWQSGWYKFISERSLSKQVYKFVYTHHQDQKLSKSFIYDLIAQLKWQALNTAEDLSKKYICFQDCLLNTETWETEPHSRDKISIFYLPYKYAKLPTECPNWHKFLETSLVQRDVLTTDQELIDLVQEMLGDFLLPNLKSATAYFLVGSGANGKSVLLDTASAIIGDEFISAMNIETLTMDKFSPPHLIGKRINISNEEESKYIKSDKFKALITGDAITAQRKFGESFTFRPSAKFVFASNKIPTFNDLNFGIIRRIRIIPFFQRFDAENPLTDIDLPLKLKEERGAIIRWAIEGAKRLVEHNYRHSLSAQSASAMEDFQGEISSAVLFFRENYVIDREAWVSNDDLYKHYKVWCEEVGKKAFSKHNFGRDLHATFKDLTVKTGRNEDLNYAKGKGIRKRAVEDELAGVEGANTNGIDISEIPIL